MRGGPAIVALVLAGMLACPAAARASEQVWKLLESGGQVVLMRHAITTAGAGDPPGMRLHDCSTQRNLTAEGRRDARRVGEAFRARGIAVERVLSSPWCRCLETARLAFGAADPWPPLGNLYGRPENRAEQVRHMQTMVGERRTGGNLVLVSHGSTISALTGVSLGTAEIVVVTPQGGGRFTVAGRLTARQSNSPDVAGRALVLRLRSQVHTGPRRRARAEHDFDDGTLRGAQWRFARWRWR